MYKKLFGTDGIRGKYPEEIGFSLAFAVGKAIACVFCLSPEKTKVLIGTDTRSSCKDLENAIADGICSMGASTFHVGIVPSGCVSYLTETKDFAAGIVISASHNAFSFNGIKVYSPNGFKSNDEYENKIENLVGENRFPECTVQGEKVMCPYLVDDFVFFIKKQLPLSPTNLKVAIDCANGASFQIAKSVFCHEKNFAYIFDTPSGENINENCGATNLKNLSKFVLENKFDLGIAFDGDADRMLAVDEEGNEINGDVLMFAFASWLKEKNLLTNNGIAFTTLSNCGLTCELEKNGIRCFQTDVGDKAVSNEMLLRNLNFGGEQSGHIIFLDKMKTGDGLLSAAMLLSMLKEKKTRAKKLFSAFRAFPQTQLNVHVEKEKKKSVMMSKLLSENILQAESELCGNGRILVRPSGTEPVIRVLVEGKELEETISIASHLAHVVEKIANE